MRDSCSKKKPYVYLSAHYGKPLFGKPTMEEYLVILDEIKLWLY
jgi:hypothetical protein